MHILLQLFFFFKEQEHMAWLAVNKETKISNNVASPEELRYILKIINEKKWGQGVAQIHVPSKAILSQVLFDHQF